MSNLLKKVVLSFFASLVVLFSLSPFLEAKAASTPAPSTSTATTAPSVLGTSTTGSSSWYDSNFFDWYDKVYNESSSPGNEIFGERYTAAQVQWVFYSVLSSAINLPYTILGFFGINVASPTPTICMIGLLHSGLNPITCAASVTNVITAFTDRFASLPVAPTLASNQNMWADVFSTNRPVSLIGYTARAIQKLNPVSEVHAQTTGGFGFGKLLVISDIWSITRNIAYAILIVGVIAIAFMIMFRVKISPQAAITIQSAIPNIVITLILITFSLAIAGLMIDLMYVVIGLLASFLSTTLGAAGSASNVYTFLVGTGDALITIVIYFITYLLGYIIASIAVVIASLVTLSPTAIIMGALMVIFSVILFFILLINLAKVVFMLVKTTALIYVAVIVAPLQLMMGVFPGPLGQGAFSGWLKGLVGKLAVFPMTGLLLFLSNRFLGMSISLSFQGAFRNNWSFAIDGIIKVCSKGMSSKVCDFFFGSHVLDGSSFWGPPLLGNGGSITGLVFLLISVGAIMMIPKVADMVEGFLSGKPIGYGQAIGETLSSGYAATFQPGVEGLRKYSQERGMVDVLTALNKQMTSGNMQWMPQRVKDYVGTVSKAKPQPFH